MANRLILFAALPFLWGAVPAAQARGNAVIVRHMQQFVPSVLHDLPVMTWTPGQEPRLPEGWKFVGNVRNFLTPGADRAPAQASVRDRQNEQQDGGRIAAPQIIPAVFSQPVVQSQHKIWLPASADLPICVFQTHGAVVFIFAGDNDILPKPVDAEVIQTDHLHGFTVVHVQWPDTIRPAIARQSFAGVEGWSLHERAEDEVTPGLRQEQRGNVMTFLAPDDRSDRKVLQIQDPRSGRRLLLGLTTQAGGTGGGTTRGVGFSVMPTLAGVVVQADADSVELRTVRNGFALDAIGPDAVPVGEADMPLAHEPEQGLALVAAPPMILQENFRRALTTVALSPPGECFDNRVMAVRAAFALGNVVVASQILTTALQDNPEGVERPGVAFLQHALQCVDRRGTQECVEDMAGANSPESQLWRGYGLMEKNVGAPVSQDDGAHGAALLTAGLSVLKNYPQPLRQHLLPQISEWIARYGSPTQQNYLSQFRGQPETRLAEAMMAMEHTSPSADGALRKLGASHDPVISGKAWEAYWQSMLKRGKMQPKDVASALDQLRPTARIAGRENSVRALEVEAHTQAGQWHEAQAVLTELKKQPEWNQTADDLDAALDNGLLKAADRGIRSARTEAELLVALERQADEAQRAEDKERLLGVLKDHFQRLGLAQREAQTLRKLLSLSHDADRKQQLTQQLVNILLRQGNVDAASELVENDPQQNAQTARLRARILVARGKLESADALIASATDDESLELRADIAEQQGKWDRAVSVLQNLTTMTRPPLGGLTFAQQYQVTRLCSDAMRANNQELVQKLRQNYLARIIAPDLHEIFDSLTLMKGQAAQTAMLVK